MNDFPNFTRLMQIQTELNDFTLAEKKVQVLHSDSPAVLPVAAQASSRLKLRDGEFIRHHSGLVRLLDMYQWAGNREYLELIECIFMVNGETDERSYRVSPQLYDNARIEVVDIMHFDLSLVALTCTTNEELVAALNSIKTYAPEDLKAARDKLDDLQLTKWWTSNKVSIATIRECAIAQYATLLNLATRYKFSIGKKREALFKSYMEVEEVYLKKVEVNYQRIKGNYDHVANANMGNNKLSK